MATTQQNEMPGPANIKLQIQDQDGCEMIFRVKRNVQLKQLMDAYCGHKSLDLSCTAFCSGSRLLSGEQTPDELEMKDDDEIRVFYWTVRQSKRPRLEASSSQHLVGLQEHENVLPQANEISHNYTLDELEERTTRSFTEAMSFLKASLHKANEGATEELKANNEALKEAEKKVAEKDLVIKRMRLEIRKLRLANAGFPSLSRKHSRLAAELARVKVEIAQIHKEVKNNRRDGSLDEQGTQARSCLHSKPNPEQSSVVRSCTVKQGNGISKPPESSEIVVEVTSLLGGRPVMFFKMQRNTPMKNLMTNYCARQKMDICNVVFYFGTLTIRDEDTPDELKMKDRDKIFASKVNNSVQHG